MGDGILVETGSVIEGRTDYGHSLRYGTIYK